MKRIEAIIQPYKLEEVRKSLLAIGINEITITEVRDFGKQEGHKEVYRGDEYKVDYLLKIRIETIVPQHLAPKVISIIMKNAQIGEKGSDKILVSNVNNVSQTFSTEIEESV